MKTPRISLAATHASSSRRALTLLAFAALGLAPALSVAAAPQQFVRSHRAPGLPLQQQSPWWWLEEVDEVDTSDSQPTNARVDSAPQTAAPAPGWLTLAGWAGSGPAGYAPALVGPQPNTASQNAEVNTTNTGGSDVYLGSSYTVPAGGDTYNNFYVGTTATGTVTHSTGTFTVSALLLGRDSGSNGTYNLSGTGSVSAPGGFYIGYSGTGTFNQSGGTAIANSVTVGRGVGSSGTYNLSAGSLSSTQPIYVGISGGIGIFNQSGGTVTTTNNNEINLGYYGSGSGTYNLNGGTLTVGYVTRFAPSTGTFNFNGGTLRPGASTTTFFQGLTTANVRGSAATANSGANVDTNGFDVTIAQPLVHSTIGGDAATDGGLTKLGTGTLTLTGANTYTGTTTFAAGTLNVGSAGALGGGGTVAFTGGTLQYSAANQTDYSARFATTSNQAFNIDTNGQAVPFASALTSSAGTLTKLGAGTLTLTGANTYTGATTVGAGTLSLSGAGTINSPGSQLLVDGTSAAAPQFTLAGTAALTSSVVLVGKYATGTFNLNGGTVTTGASNVGEQSGSVGIFNQSGGTYNGTSTSVSFAGTGTFNHSAGSYTLNTSLYVATSGTGSLGTYNLSGTGALSTPVLYLGAQGTGVVNQTGGTVTVGSSGIQLSTSTGASGTYNLNGGTLTTGNVSRGSGTGVFNFNGGTLRAGASTTTFFSGLTTANVRGSGATANSGANVDTNGFNVTVAQALLHSTLGGDAATDGGLTKLGTGTLTLTGANTYTGPTNVNGGTLLVNGTSSGTGAVTVQNSGSVLGGTGTLAGAVGVTTGTLAPGNNTGAAGSAANSGRLTVGALTLSSTAMSIFDINSGTTYDQLFANGNIALGGSKLTLNVPTTNQIFTAGQVLDLFHNNIGTLSGTFSNFADNGTYTYGGETFRANYTSTDFTLTALTTVPEPSTWAGGALLLGGAGWILRRRVHRA